MGFVIHDEDEEAQPRKKLLSRRAIGPDSDSDEAEALPVESVVAESDDSDVAESEEEFEQDEDCAHVVRFPNDKGGQLTADLVIGMVLSHGDWLKHGHPCDEIEDVLKLRDSSANIEKYTRKFESEFGIVQPKFTVIKKFAPGIQRDCANALATLSWSHSVHCFADRLNYPAGLYAATVHGRLPQKISRMLLDRGIRYRTLKDRHWAEEITLTQRFVRR